MVNTNNNDVCKELFKLNFIGDYPSYEPKNTKSPSGILTAPWLSLGNKRASSLHTDPETQETVQRVHHPVRPG